jgi:plastocyanin
MSRANWILAIVIVVLALGGAAYAVQHDRSIALRSSQDSDQAGTSVNGESTVIIYTDAGFTPPTVMVTPGTTVTWTNQSSRKLWVIDASLNVDACAQDGAALNECAAIDAGGSYSYTAPSPGTITYANREHREDTGSIVVSSESGAFNPDAVPQ